ncbi:hypothetical protein [Mucilaginibacter pedocola]|nr:hypothetical protein [Mucilaginibacter pedocola]
MSLADTRHITLLEGDDAHLIKVQSHTERVKGKLRVRFIFPKDAPVVGLDEIIADNVEGYVRMTTTKGKPLTAGPLFDQLYVWFDYIVKH